MNAAAANITPVKRLERVIFFFPFQLLWLHIKKNHILLIFWLFLFALITRSVALKYGIPYLFLYPEYLGSVNIISHLILGFSCGGFIMAFNISSYIINGFRFPIIATLSKPFLKYCINNFIIPVFFLIVYLYHLIDFQLNSELVPPMQVFLHAASFLIGNTIFILLCLAYFLSTNKDVIKLFGKRKNYNNAVGGVLHKKEKPITLLEKARAWKVHTYLVNPFRIALARESDHYDAATLRKVFSQNHINASLFEIMVIITVIVLGLFREYGFFQIPAGASIFILFTLFLMFSSALHSWLKGWSTFVFILLIIFINLLSNYPVFNYDNYAYGLNYEVEKAQYNQETLVKLATNDSVIQQDFQNNLGILENWKERNIQNALERNERPKLVIVCTSGGGLRSALWTLLSLQHADSLMKGELMRHTHLITGSSGGMVGAAYLREAYLRQQNGEAIDLYDHQHRDNISTDILNPIALTIAVNDLYPRLQYFEDGEYSYTKDRAYAFEKQLNKNTGDLLTKRLIDYQLPEAEAKIPMMLFAPTIANDGRRLLISSQNMAHMIPSGPLSSASNNALIESIEFRRFFANQNADNLRFTSALRMSATFPYVLPNVSLPSTPEIEVMDAGIRDNYGISNALKYIFTFREWLEHNTSGIIILQIRDKSKERKILENPRQSLLQSITSPLGSFYSNWPIIQTYHQDELIQYASSWYKKRIDIIDLQLKHEKDKAISLSWHLTEKEKETIGKALLLEENQQAINRLRSLLD